MVAPGYLVEIRFAAEDPGRFVAINPEPQEKSRKSKEKPKQPPAAKPETTPKVETQSAPKSDEKAGPMASALRKIFGN